MTDNQPKDTNPDTSGYRLPGLDLLDRHVSDGETPCSKPGIVTLRSLLDTKEFAESDMDLPLALGRTIDNKLLFADLAKIPHLIVAGTSWTETAYAQHAIITSLLYKRRPDELKLVLIDTKKVEFSLYEPIAPQYMPLTEKNPVVTDVGGAVRTINKINALMEQRYVMLRTANAANIKDYNMKYNSGQLSPADGHQPMPYVVVLILEYSDLLMTAGMEFELPLTYIAQLARAVGIHIVLATRRPTSTIISSTVKANFPGRMAFKMSSPAESQAIFDLPGAEKLAGRGDMLFLNGDAPIRAQCAYIDEREVERVCGHIARQPTPAVPLVLPEQAEGLASRLRDAPGLEYSNLDPLFEDAALFIARTQVASTSMLQRKFCIGYNRAGRLMAQLEKASIVGPAQQACPRKVNVTGTDELEAIISKLKA